MTIRQIVDALTAELESRNLLDAEDPVALLFEWKPPVGWRIDVQLEVPAR